MILNKIQEKVNDDDDEMDSTKNKKEIQEYNNDANQSYIIITICKRNRYISFSKTLCGNINR